jgi:DNA-binding CsgD family transcriptional regulator
VSAIGQDALRLYETLLARPGTTLDDAAELLGLPVQHVAPLVESLRDGGLVRGPEGAPEAAPPDVAVEDLLAAHYARLAAESARVAQLRRDLAGIAGSVREAAERDPAHEVVLTMPAILARLTECTVRARTEILCMVPTASGVAEASTPLLTSNRDAVRRGVSLRTLMPDEVADDPAGWAYARALTDLGDDVRTCPSIALIANIFDRRTAMVPSDPAVPRAGALVVTNPTLVAGLVSLFEQLWPTALPIAPHAPAAPLDERDRQVMELLLRGAKDEQVARALGMSVRTVRARVAALMARAGARSRFQLAAVALHHGWISAG